MKTLLIAVMMVLFVTNAFSGIRQQFYSHFDKVFFYFAISFSFLTLRKNSVHNQFTSFFQLAFTRKTKVGQLKVLIAEECTSEQIIFIYGVFNSALRHSQCLISNHNSSHNDNNLLMGSLFRVKYSNILFYLILSCPFLFLFQLTLNEKAEGWKVQLL